MASMHDFAGRMSDELFNALEAHATRSGETNTEAFLKAMRLYLRITREDNEVFIRNKHDKSKMIQLVL